MKRLVLLSLVVVMVVVLMGPASQASAKKYKIALSMSYIGNDWQGVTRNILLAVAKLHYKDKVNVDVFVAGPSVPNQIRQIKQMIAKRYDAIILYPISPTALNKVISQACKAGIVVMAYDSEVTAPCAYNLTFDQYDAGKRTAEWLMKAMDGKGNLVIIGGVPGTSVDQLRTQAAKDVFAKYPDIKIIAEFWGMWAQGPAEEGMAKVIAAHPKIDGVWAQVGGVGVPKALLDAGRPLVPIATESANQWRLNMMDPEMKKQGLSGCSYGSPLYQGAAALHYTVKILDGDKSIPKKILIPYDYVEEQDLKLCETGSNEELEGGCNVFPADIVSPGFFADWYSPEFTKGVDLNMALTGLVPED